MSTSDAWQGFQKALSDPESLCRSWYAVFERSVIRMPSRIEYPVFKAQSWSLVEGLNQLLDKNGEISEGFCLQPGANVLRELEQQFCFSAATIAAEGQSAFDLGAWIAALEETLSAFVEGAAQEELRRYLQWISVLSSDSFANALRQATQESWMQGLDQSTPLLMLTPELPALLFVSRPNTAVASSILGRLLLTIVRTGARAVLLDLRSIEEGCEGAILRALEPIWKHQRVAGRVHFYVSGLRNVWHEDWNQLAKDCQCEISIHEYFESSSKQALNAISARLGG